MQNEYRIRGYKEDNPVQFCNLSEPYDMLLVYL